MLRFTRIDDQPLDSARAAHVLRLRLSYHERVGSRLVVQMPNGTAVAIVLPRGSRMRDGTVLSGDDGAVAVVEEEVEPVTRVTADSVDALMRAVYHLANRHVPVQLASDYLLIERDAVLERMLVALGVSIEHAELPFNPEIGAYHGHDDNGHRHREEADQISPTIGEQLSIEAHQSRGSSA
jgi:urease accessory protein